MSYKAVPFLFENARQLEKISEIALYYGFRPIKAPRVTKDDIFCIHGDTHNARIKNKLCPRENFPHEKISILRKYVEHNMRDLSEPVMVSYKNHDKDNHTRFSMDIIGNSKSISEALLIKSAVTILNEQGYEDICVHINSFGKKESLYLFEREVASYFKKYMQKLSPEARQAFKENPLSILSHHRDELEENVLLNAPQSISFLDEKSRDHFKEVLEYLEELHIPYIIDDSLVGNKDTCCDTVFEIRYKEPAQKKDLLAYGVRYSPLVKRMNLRRNIPAVGISLSLKVTRKRPEKQSVETLVAPKFYFVHLGFQAKVKSLDIIEKLRKENVALLHALTKEKCRNQLSLAEKIHSPYLIIMGVKEAMEDTVIVRDMTNRSQIVIPTRDLPAYVRKLNK